MTALYSLPDPARLRRIEDEFWAPAGVVPVDAVAAVRGSPITAEKFLRHAARQAREYSLRDANMFSISVDLILPDWPLKRILTERLATFPRYATCPLATLAAAGFEVVATGERPHADVVLRSFTIVEAGRLADLFRPNEHRNEYRRR